MLIVSELVSSRFWEKVRRVSKNECWLWEGGKDKERAYGRAWDGRRTRQAHAFAWELYNGKRVPLGKIVRHSCDNPPCCNPGHLLLGTVQDNINDMISRGRDRIAYRDVYVPKRRRPMGARNGTHTHPEKVLRGQDAVHDASCKLSVEEVRQIRALHKKGDSQTFLAGLFRVSPTQIFRIVNRQRWAWLTD